MPAPASYDYAVVRVVPRVDREEFINAGVILFCKARHFLAARVRMDDERLRASPQRWMWTWCSAISTPSRAFAPATRRGPIARLVPSERFHWLVAPRSTMIQVSPVYGGLCDDPAARLDELLLSLVAS
jgi:hypothetical protein